MLFEIDEALKNFSKTYLKLTTRCGERFDSMRDGLFAPLPLPVLAFDRSAVSHRSKYIYWSAKVHIKSLFNRVDVGKEKRLVAIRPLFMQHKLHDLHISWCTAINHGSLHVRKQCWCLSTHGFARGQYM